MNKTLSTLLVAAATVTALSGCSTLFDKDNTPPPARLSALPAQAKPIHVLWQTTVGAGSDIEFPNMVPALSGNRVFTASKNGTITAINRTTGKIIWQRATSQPISTGVSASAHRMFVGCQNGTVPALDQTTGRMIWTAKATSAMLATPAASKTRVIVKSIDNRITALSATTGRHLWSAFEKQPHLILNASSAARIGGDSVYAGFANGTLARYNLQTGGQYWKQTIATSEGIFPIQRMVDIDSNPVVTPRRIYTATWQGQLASVNANTGDIEWSRPVSTYVPIAYDGYSLYLSNAKGVVQAFKTTTGLVLWQNKSLMGHRLTGPALDGDYLVVGDDKGWVHWLRRYNGHLVSRIHTNSGVYTTPIVRNHIAYITTQEGRLMALRIAN